MTALWGLKRMHACRMSDRQSMAMGLLNINPKKEAHACREKIGFSCGVMCAMQDVKFILRKDVDATLAGVVGSVTRQQPR